MASENLSPTRLVCGIGDMWNDGRIIYLRGWVIAPGAGVTALTADLPGGRQPVPHTQAPGRTDAVFYSLLVTGTPMVRITLRATTPTGETMLGELDLLNPELPDPDPEAAEYAASARALEHLKHEVNTRKLDLLELGSRVLADTPSPWRDAFAGAASYTGFDIHAGPGVDVVGDAHRLSAIVGRASADAVFSVAVLEHIAMPWIVAREINRTLRPGGLVHVTTHQTWPIHERPNDFWRFSDVAMKLLFGPMHGFEVEECGMYGRLSLHHRKPSADYAELPFNVAYSTVFILARKVAEIDALPAEPGERELAELSRLYPPPTNL